MISLDVIDEQIEELEERHDTTWAVVERLCYLYTVRDHICGDAESNLTASKTTPGTDGSEFVKACSDVDWGGLMAILDEHMTGIKVVCPKEYESVMRKIKALK